MAVCQLQRLSVRSCIPRNVSCTAAFQRPSLPATQRRPSFSSKHSTFCGRNPLASRAGYTTASSRLHKARRAPVAGLWFRSSEATGSAAASAAAAQAAAIMSVPLWQHAARSTFVVVVTLALAVTVSRFLIINSGKLEAGEVCPSGSWYDTTGRAPYLLSTHMLQQIFSIHQRLVNYAQWVIGFESLADLWNWSHLSCPLCRRSPGWLLLMTRRSSPASPGCAML